jgi:hypothetical protein
MGRKKGLYKAGRGWMLLKPMTFTDAADGAASADCHGQGMKFC